MAFTNTIGKKFVTADGYVIEEGTWDGNAVTTGTITADTTIQPECPRIEEFWFSSNADTGVYPALDTGYFNKIKITFGSGDAGTYRIKGKVV